MKFKVKIERVFDKNEANDTFKAQSSEFVQKTKLTLKCKNGWRLHLAHHCSTLSQVTFEERGGFLQLQICCPDLSVKMQFSNSAYQDSITILKPSAVAFLHELHTSKYYYFLEREGQKSYLSFDEGAASLSQNSEGLELVISDRGRILQTLTMHQNLGNRQAFIQKSNIGYMDNCRLFVRVAFDVK